MRAWLLEIWVLDAALIAMIIIFWNGAFFDLNVGAALVAFACALVIVTAYYAWQGRETVRAIRWVEEQRLRPRIVVYLEQREDWLNLVDLVLENQGGAAQYVRFTIENDISLFTDKNKLSDVSFLKNGFTFLPAGRMVRVPLLNIIGHVEDLRAVQTAVVVDYDDPETNTHYTDRYLLEFDSLRERTIATPPLYDISQELKKVKDELYKLRTSAEKYFEK